MSVKQKIARASFILIFASILGHSLGLFKEMLLASYFGVSKAIDAFYTAITIPNMLMNIILSPFTVIFIPIFIRYRLKDKAEANMLASVILNYLYAALFTFSVLLYFFAPFVITHAFSGLDPESVTMAVRMLKIMAVSVLLLGSVQASSALLNSLEHFSIPSLSQSFVTMSIIFFIAFSGNALGADLLAWALVTGLGAQALLLVFIARRQGFHYAFSMKSNSPAIKELLSFAGIFLFLSVISQLSMLINRSIASHLPTGSIAALGYANKILQVPLVVFAGSISIAMYPFFSMQAAEDKIDDLKDTFAQGIKMSGFLFIPMAVTLFVFSKPLIAALFERGAFTHDATLLTGKILMFYSFQLLAYYIVGIMMRLLFALQDYMTILKVTVINLAAIIIMNYLFIRIIDPPAAGIALSNSLSLFISSVLYFIFIKKKLKFVHGVSIFKALSAIFLVSVIAAVPMRLLYAYLVSVTNPTLFVNMFNIGSSAVFGLLVFLMLSYAVKLREFVTIFGLLKTKFQERFL